MRKWEHLKLLIISVVLIDIGQLLLKFGVNKTGDLSWAFSNWIYNIFLFLINPLIWAGVILMVLAGYAWLRGLSKTSLSYAYPLLSFGYVLVAILSWIFFAETMNSVKLLGLGIIALGVVMLSRT